MSAPTDQLQAPQQLDQPILQEEKAKKPLYKRKWFIALAAVVALGAIGSAMGGSEDAPATNEAAVEQPAAPEAAVEEPAAPVEDSAAVETTVSQDNALRSAENYIDTMPFSREGLIKQLEFEGYTTEDATWAVDQLDVDWNEQAVLAAENYLEMMPFSREGLIQQLEFEGYTTEQATYAADQVGL